MCVFTLQGLFCALWLKTAVRQTKLFFCSVIYKSVLSWYNFLVNCTPEVYSSLDHVNSGYLFFLLL